MKINTLLLIISSVLLSSIAQVLLKWGMSGTSSFDVTESHSKLFSLIQPLLNGYVIMGLFLYFSSALVWLSVLSKVQLSIAYPFVGLGFIITMFLSYLIFSEALTLSKVIGTLSIVFGVVFISKG